LNTEDKEISEEKENIEKEKVAEKNVEKEKDKQEDSTEKQTEHFDRIERLNVELKEALEEVANYKDKYLRSLAELDNQRKRATREKEEIRKYATDKLILSILPVVDNFERAIDANVNSDSVKDIMDGVKLIFRQLKELLEKEGLKAFDSVGHKFDPYRHDALVAIESKEHEPSTIIEELEKGYLLGEKVLRPAKVTVSKQGEEKESEENGSKRQSNRD